METGYAVAEDATGGFFVAGNSQSAWGASTTDGLHHLYVLRTSSDGQVIWQQVMRTAGASEGLSTVRTADGGFVIAGYNEVVQANLRLRTQMLLIKFDSLGKKLWSRTYPHDSWAEAHCVRCTSDGGFVISGTYLIKTDVEGNLEWENAELSGESVLEARDGGFVVVGSRTVEGRRREVFIGKAGRGGQTQWARTIPFEGSEDSQDEATCISPTSLLTYAICGSSTADNVSRTLLMMTTEAGFPVWKRAFGKYMSEGGRAVVEHDSGGFVVVGSARTERNGRPEAYVAKVALSGDVEWEQLLSDRLGWSVLSDISRTRDGAYVTTGLGVDFDLHLTKFRVWRGFFVRGDSVGDLHLDITDAVSVLYHLFDPQQVSADLSCLDAADVNDDGKLDITDCVRLLSFLYLGASPPSAPFPGCGADPTEDDLGCEIHAECW